MINVHRKTILVLLLSIASLALSACSTLDSISSKFTEKPTANYHNNKSVKSLEVPPDLTTPEFDNAFALPKGVVSLKTGKVISQPGSSSVVAPKVDLSSVIKSGDRDVLKVYAKYPKAVALTETMINRMGFQTLNKSPSGNQITAKYNGEDVLTSTAGLSIITKFRITLGEDGRVVNRSLLKGENYVISIISENGSPIVRFEKATGTKLSDAQHAKIVSLLNTTFNN